MRTGFVLHVWGRESREKLLKAYAPDLTAEDLRPYTEHFYGDDPRLDPDMLNGAYVARPDCEADVARLFGAAPIEGRYTIDSATHVRPEPDEVLEQEHRDWLKGKTRVDGIGLCIFGEGFAVAEAFSTTVDPDDLIPYLQDVDIDGDPRLEWGDYRVHPGAEAAVAAMFGFEPVDGGYFVGREYRYV